MEATFGVFINWIAYDRGVKPSGELLSQLGRVELSKEQQKPLLLRQLSVTLENSESLEDLKEAEETIQVTKNYYLGILHHIPCNSKSRS